jgi:hypothetical protein
MIHLVQIGFRPIRTPILDRQLAYSSNCLGTRIVRALDVVYRGRIVPERARGDAPYTRSPRLCYTRFTTRGREGRGWGKGCGTTHEELFELRVGRAFLDSGQEL